MSEDKRKKSLKYFLYAAMIFNLFGLSFITNCTAGNIYRHVNVSRLEEKARKEADLNKDGEVDAKEAVLFYKRFGWSGEQIFGSLKHIDLFHIVENSCCVDDRTKEILARYICGGRDPRYYGRSEVEDMRREAFAREIVDVDSNGVVDYDEAEKVLEFAFGDSGKDRLVVSRCGYGRDHCGFFNDMILPWINRNSDLEVYLENENEKPLNSL